MAKIKMKYRAATVAESFESFLNSRKANGVVDKTLQTYRYHFSAISKYLDTSIEIDMLTKSILENTIAAMRDSTLSTNSIHSGNKMS